MSVHRTRLKNLCITCCRCCCQSLSEALSIPPIPIHTDSSCLICVFRSVAGNLVAGAGWVNLCWVAHTKWKQCGLSPVIWLLPSWCLITVCGQCWSPCLLQPAEIREGRVGQENGAGCYELSIAAWSCQAGVQSQSRGKGGWRRHAIKKWGVLLLFWVVKVGRDGWGHHA